MTQRCSIKPCWLETDFRFKEIETLGGQITPQQFKMAALVVGAVFFVFLGLAKLDALNPTAAVAVCSGLGAVNVLMVAVILLAKWERDNETFVEKLGDKANNLKFKIENIL